MARCMYNKIVGRCSELRDQRERGEKPDESFLNKPVSGFSFNPADTGFLSEPDLHLCIAGASQAGRCVQTYNAIDKDTLTPYFTCG